MPAQLCGPEPVQLDQLDQLRMKHLGAEVGLRAVARAGRLFAFGSPAMKRWDRLVDAYVEEYRARGIVASPIATAFVVWRKTICSGES